MTLDAAVERGIRQPTIPATVTATATAPRQALGGWWRRIRWQRKWDYAVDNYYLVMGQYNFSD